MAGFRNGRGGVSDWRHALSMLVALPALLACTWMLLSPSLSGGFLFDDIPNLQPLGDNGGVVDRETFDRFVWGGFSGPLGRPVSLLTFVANAQNWPADPYPFKATNLGLHLGVGLLLFVLMRMVLLAAGVPCRRAGWLALFVTAAWLVHPLQSATVFYVIQRMSQLSALFILLGAIGWLHGRNALVAGRPWSGYLWMSLSVGLGALIGLFAKETAAVLPFLVIAMLVTVAPVPATARNGVWRAWFVVFLGLPLAAMLAIFADGLIHYGGGFPGRPFGPIERLTTQWLVLWDYLRQLALPRAAPALFNEQWNRDAADVSMVWPITALGGWLLLVGAAWWYRRRQPILALGVFGFLALHSLEAGPVSLEVYFLHRNYLAIAFPLLAAGAVVARTGRMSVVVGLVVVAGLAVQAHQGSRLWGNPHDLFAHWARDNPRSLRAQHESMMRHLMQTEYDVAGERLAVAAAHYPDSTTVATDAFLIACFTGQPVAPHLRKLRRTAATDAYRHSTDAGLGVLDQAIHRENCMDPADVPLFEIIDTFRRNPHYQRNAALAELYEVEYRIRARRGQLQEALAAVDGKLRHRPTEAAWMTRAYFLERLGRFDEAADALARARRATPHRGLGRWVASDSARQQRLNELIRTLRQRAGTASGSTRESMPR